MDIKLSAAAKSALAIASDMISDISQFTDIAIADLSKQEKRLLKAACKNAIDTCNMSKSTAITIGSDSDTKQKGIDIWQAPIDQLQSIIDQL